MFLTVPNISRKGLAHGSQMSVRYNIARIFGACQNKNKDVKTHFSQKMMYKQTYYEKNNAVQN